MSKDLPSAEASRAPDDSNVFISTAKEELAVLLQQLHQDDKLKEKEINCLSRVIMGSQELIEEYIKLRDSGEPEPAIIHWLVELIKDPRVAMSISPSPSPAPILASSPVSFSPLTADDPKSRSPLSRASDLKDLDSKKPSPILPSGPPRSHYLTPEDALKRALLEVDFQPLFLLSYRKYIPAPELLRRVFHLFYHPLEESERDGSQGSSPMSRLSSKSESPILAQLQSSPAFAGEEEEDPVMTKRKRAMNLLGRWISEYYEQDFTREMKTKLTESLAHAGSLFDSSAVRAVHDAVQQEERRLSIPKPVPPKPPAAGPLDVLRVAATELSRELTLIDFAHFQRIDKLEFVDHRWKDRSVAPNAQFFIDRFNLLTFWVATEILERKSQEERATALHHFLAVANDCVKLNNFHALFAIMAALSSHPVFRLKDLKEVLDAQHRAIHENLTRLIASDENYKSYRPLLKQCVDKGLPCLPHLAITFKDLFVLEEPTVYETETRLIDFSRIERVHQEIKAILPLTKRDFMVNPHAKPLKPNVALQTRLAQQIITRTKTEEQLIQLSLKLEPKMTWQQHREARQQMAINVLLEEGFL